MSKRQNIKNKLSFVSIPNKKGILSYPPNYIPMSLSILSPKVEAYFYYLIYITYPVVCRLKYAITDSISA